MTVCPFINVELLGIFQLMTATIETTITNETTIIIRSGSIRQPDRSVNYLTSITRYAVNASANTIIPLILQWQWPPGQHRWNPHQPPVNQGFISTNSDHPSNAQNSCNASTVSAGAIHPKQHSHNSVCPAIS